MKQVLIKNFRLKLFSLFAAIVMYMFIAFENENSQTLKIPLQIELAPDITIISDQNTNLVAELEVTYRGSLAQFMAWDERTPQPYVLDLKNAGPGTIKANIQLEKLPKFAGMQAMEVSPAQIPLTLDRLIERNVPIKEDIRGNPASGFILGEVLFTPEVVTIIGPSTQVEHIDFVMSKPLDIQGATTEINTDVELRSPNYPITLKSDKRKVNVTIIVEEEHLKRSLKNVPIVLESENPRIRLKNRMATLPIRGPASVINNNNIFDVKKVRLVISNDDIATLNSGTAEFPLEIQGLPDGVYLIGRSPTAVVEYVPEKRTNKQRKKTK